MDPTATFRFSSRDGTGLYGEWFVAQPLRATALVIHGYAEHCGRYRELAHVLTALGVATFTYDMRGHGRAEGQRGFVNSVDDYLDDMGAALDELTTRAREIHASQDLPRFLIGHSNGGMVLLRALTDPARRPEHVTAAILSSPCLGFKGRVSPVKDFIGKLAGRWLPALSLPNGIPIEHLTSDPAKQEERRLDTLCHDVASSRWYVSVLEAQKYIAEHVPRIDVPTLWLVSGADRIVDASASKLARARLQAPVTYHELAEMEHEVFNERDRAKTFDLLRTFIDDVLGTR